MKRYHYKKFHGEWWCFDHWTKMSGFGATIKTSFEDCMRNLEMATSDIHK